MEVSDRSAPAPRGLTPRLARPRALPAVALAATVAAALAIVVAQPLRSPWWTYADADATYTASGLNLLLGVPVRFVDHPGLPLEEAIAVAFGVDQLIRLATGDVASGQEYVDERMLDLDRTRPFARGFAAVFYLAGSALSFLLLSRLLGHWTWGLAGGLLWLAAPGLAAMSIQFRPDVPLAVLCLVVTFLVARALETRSAALYGAAALTLGVAVMVKLHAAGLLPMVALAALWRPPRPDWGRELALGTARFVRGHRLPLAGLATAWLALAVIFNHHRLPFAPTRAMLAATFAPILLVAAYAAVALLARRLGPPRPLRRLLDPFNAYLAGAFVAGLYIPVTLELPDGMRALVNVAKGLTGTGINESIEPFSAPLDQLLESPLREALLFFVLAGVGAVVGLKRRAPLPVVCFVGAATLGVMAQARLAAVHYFAPAFVVSVPAALWLLRREGGRAASLLVWPVIAYAVVPQLQHREAPARDAERFARSAAPSLEFIRERLRPGEVGLTPSYWPHPDVRYFATVQQYVSYTPEYPYRFLESTSAAGAVLAERRLTPRFYTGPEAEAVDGTQAVTLGDLGTFTVRRTAGAPSVVELLSGPGVDAPIVPPAP